MTRPLHPAGRTHVVLKPGFECSLRERFLTQWTGIDALQISGARVIISVGKSQQLDFETVRMNFIGCDLLSITDTSVCSLPRLSK